MTSKTTADGIMGQLASAAGRKDEALNVELAGRIAEAEDGGAVSQLIAILQEAKKAFQSDAIKVLYEIGERRPELIAEHVPVFKSLLSSKNNRLQWGGMCALAQIAHPEPARIYAELTDIMQAAGRGSVITRDNAVAILLTLLQQKQYRAEIFPLLLEQLRTSPPNQVPMYAERALPLLQSQEFAAVHQALEARLDDIEKESKRRRVQKVMQRLQP